MSRTSGATVYALTIAALAEPVHSVVIPLHDEEEMLSALYERLVVVLDGLDDTWELLLVDDGSRDGTYGLAVELHARHPRVNVVRLSRNFGHQIALSAGLDLAQGQAVITGGTRAARPAIDEVGARSIWPQARSPWAASAGPWALSTRPCG